MKPSLLRVLLVAVPTLVFAAACSSDSSIDEVAEPVPATPTVMAPSVPALTEEPSLEVPGAEVPTVWYWMWLRRGADGNYDATFDPTPILRRRDDDGVLYLDVAQVMTDSIYEFRLIRSDGSVHTILSNTGYAPEDSDYEQSIDNEDVPHGGTATTSAGDLVVVEESLAAIEFAIRGEVVWSAERPDEPLEITSLAIVDGMVSWSLGSDYGDRPIGAALAIENADGTEEIIAFPNIVSQTDTMMLGSEHADSKVRLRISDGFTYAEAASS